MEEDEECVIRELVCGNTGNCAEDGDNDTEGQEGILVRDVQRLKAQKSRQDIRRKVASMVKSVH